MNGFSQQVGGLAGANTGTVTDSGAAKTLTVNSATTTTYSGTLIWNLALTKSSTGTLGLAGVNSYNGATTITGGTLSLQNASALGASTGVSVATGTTLDIDNVQIASSIPVTMLGVGVGGLGAMTGEGMASYAGSINLTGGTTIGVARTALIHSTYKV